MIKDYDLSVEGDNIPVTCRRCSGRGFMSEYSNVFAGQCFDCGGRKLGTVERSKAEKIVAKREADKARRDAKRESERLARVAKAEARAAAWRQENADLVASLLAYDGTNRVLCSFRDDLRDNASFYLGFDQTCNAEELLEAEKALVTPAEGRQVVTGTIVAFKTVYSRFGSARKMLVQCDGYRLFGSVPAFLEDTEQGQEVTFTATLEPKEAGFGFFSRPAAPKVAKAA